jgi:hypothetical protein
MPTLLNTGSTKPTSEQDAQKVATYNALLDEQDAANNGMLILSVAGSSNVTLTTAQGLNKIMKFTGALTGNINVLIRVPSGSPVGYSGRMFVVWNFTTGAFTLTIKTTAGGSTGVAVTQSQKQMLFHDGTNVYAAAASIA